MNTKALRQKILDLAIRGKLVPQDPHDEPASVLLERIRDEKLQMVKDGRLKPKDIKNDTIIFKGEDNLHYEQFADGTVKCIEDEIPFEVPENWEWCRINSISENVTDGDHQPPPQTESGFPFLVISNVSDGYIHFENTRYVSKEYYQTLSEYRKARAGDLLFTVTGSYGIPVPVESSQPFCFQRHIAIIRPCEISNQYLSIVLSSKYIKRLCDELSTGTAQKTVGLATLRNFLIPIPPANEQALIIDKVHRLLILVDEIRDNKNQLIDVVNAAKLKILDLAIRGRLVPQDPNDEPASALVERIRAEKEKLIQEGKIKRDKKESFIFKGEDNSYYEKTGSKTVCIDGQLPLEIPDSWTWCRGYSCFMGMKTKKPEGEFFNYIDIDSIDNKQHIVNQPKHLATKAAPSRANRALQEGSVVFSLVRPYLENVAFIDVTLNDCIASTGFYICNSNGTYYPEFMFYLMISKYVIDGLNQFMKGDNSPSISKESIENWLYPVPPYNEQIAIVERLKSIKIQIMGIETSLT